MENRRIVAHMTLWENIKIFYLVAKNNSFKEAASILNMDVSTASRRVQQLENSLEQPLFLSKNPIVLSPIGERLKQYVQNSCANMLELEKNLFNHLAPKEKLKFYVNDLYFFNLMEQIYDCHSMKNILDINDVSIVDSDFINKLIAKRQDNFIYISSNENFIKHITLNKNYISWPIYNLPICWYEKKNDNSHFISYTGMENWLLNLHQQYILKHQINTNRIVESNSIEIIFNLIQCSGSTILPTMINKENVNAIKHELKITPITERNLFFLCHVSDVFLKLIF